MMLLNRIVHWANAEIKYEDDHMRAHIIVEELKIGRQLEPRDAGYARKEGGHG